LKVAKKIILLLFYVKFLQLAYVKNVQTLPVVGFTIIYGTTPKIHCDIFDIYSQALFVEQIPNLLLNIVSYNKKWPEIV
jgi:hypothetical protein